MALNFRYTKIPVRPEIIYQHIRERVVKELEVVGESHVAERNEVVREWDNKPQFGYEIQIKQKEIWVVVKVTNPDEPLQDGRWTIGELWNALDKTGTPSHEMGPIVPRKKKALAFVVGGKYNAKTKPGGRFGGSGKVVGGETVICLRTKKFTHPGFKPRHFTERINKELLPLFRKQAERGYRLGHQEALYRHR